MMLTEICAEIKNYFTGDKDRVIGDFSVVSGSIVPSVELLDGQYYRIVGSVFNDGVHLYPDDELKDEPEFHGAVWRMRVPQAVIDIALEIEEWLDKYGGVESPNMSPYTSESFGGYSYSKAQGGSSAGGNGGAAVDWRSVFLQRLNPYRKIRSV